MSYYVKAVCSRCGRTLEGNYYDACPHCAKEGVNANYRTIYHLVGAKLPADQGNQPGIFRFRNFYPIEDNAPVVSIGEGNTPLLHIPRMGKKLGLSRLYVKDESRNPTWSQKDRLCAIMVSRALAANAPGMVVSSTGNQGASVAAYCAAAGIPCAVFTTSNVSPAMKTLMQAYGAKLFITPSMADRVTIMKKVVSELGFLPGSGMPKPPIGSDCFGLDGYKSIAFELYEQCKGEMPDWIVFSISYGGTLEGVYRGLCDLKAMGYIDKLPRIAAAERYGPATRTIAAGKDDPIAIEDAPPSILTSMATPMVAYHTVKAIKDSGGAARETTDEASLAMHKLLAQSEGIFAEPSSLPPFVAIEKLLNEGIMKPDEKIIVVLTSTGLKYIEIAQSWLPDIPCINPTLEEFRAAAADNYGWKV